MGLTFVGSTSRCDSTFMLPPGISVCFLHMALRCEQCLTCCFTAILCRGTVILSEIALDLILETNLDVMQETREGALCTGTVALKAAGFVSLVASLLAK